MLSYHYKLVFASTVHDDGASRCLHEALDSKTGKSCDFLERYVVAKSKTKFNRFEIMDSKSSFP